MHGVCISTGKLDRVGPLMSLKNDKILFCVDNAGKTTAFCISQKVFIWHIITSLFVSIRELH